MKKILSLLLFSALLLSLAPLAPAENAPAIKIDGEFGDWAGIKPLAPGDGKLAMLYAFATATHLYVALKGVDAANISVYDVLLDIDDNPQTGFLAEGVFGKAGADFLIETWASAYYPKTLDGKEWKWDVIEGDFPVEKAMSADNTAVEIALPLEAIKNPAKLRIGAQALTETWEPIGYAPAQGSDLLPVPAYQDVQGATEPSLLLQTPAPVAGQTTSAPVVLPQMTAKKTPWNDAQTFVCYYGQYDEAMKGFDVAILESRSLKDEDIKALNDAGVYTIAYITIGEDDSLTRGDGKGPGGYASYYFDDGGKPAQNGNWNSYYVDAGNPLWQDTILEKAKAIIARGCDGLFLDTIDTVDIYPDTIPGMVELIKKLKETFPGKKIVANRGMTIMKEFAPYIDGMMLEDVATTYDFENKKYLEYNAEEMKVSQDLCNAINRVRAPYGYPVFGLDYADPAEKEKIQRYYDIIWANGFIPYVSTIYLDKVYVHNIKPQSAKGSKVDLTEPTPIPLGERNTDPANLALADHGAKVKTDSVFVGYGTDTLIDGYRNDPGLSWDKVAWASAETGADHWVQITFAEKKKVNLVTVFFAMDAGQYKTPRKLSVQIPDGDGWKEIAAGDVPPQLQDGIEISFAPVITDAVRLVQPSGQGPQDRPDLMWLAEVEIR